MSRAIRLYAHRGAAAEMPENTLPSFRRALEHGADALEMDLHMTADGHIVVSHDPTTERMCDRALTIRRATLAELKALDAGHGFVASSGERPHAGGDCHIPTLDEVLDEFRDVVINVDVKQSNPSMVQPVLDLVRRHRAEDRVILASFRLRTLLAIRAAGYEGVTALPGPEVIALMVVPGVLFRRLPLRGSAAQVPPRAGMLTLGSRRFIERCHASNVRVDFWTVNDPAEARRLLELGADGIMTDDPGAIAPVFAELRARQS